VQPIQVLMDEHRTVESILDSLCMFTRTTSEDGTDGRDTLARFVELFRIFDDLHHMKEEDMLFERMLHNGFPSDGGPLAVMLADHKTCRELVSTLAGLAEQAEAWTGENHLVLHETATEYTLLLKSHIALDRSFDEFEKKWGSDGKLVDFRGRVAELREAWPAADGPTPASGCGM